MADYYAILKRAIGALPEPTGEARRAVYEKARTALVNQLKAFDPPLTASEITQQRLQLEDAIRKVEAEAAKGILKSALDRAAQQRSLAAAPPAAPAPRPGPAPSGAAGEGGGSQTAAPMHGGASAPVHAGAAPASHAPGGAPAGGGLRPSIGPETSRPAPRMEAPRTDAPRMEPPRPGLRADAGAMRPAPSSSPQAPAARPVAEQAAAQGEFAEGLARSDRDASVAAGSASLAEAPRGDARRDGHPAGSQSHEPASSTSPLFRRSMSEAGQLGMAAAEASRHARDVLAETDSALVPPESQPAEARGAAARRGRAETTKTRDRRRPSALEADAGQGERRSRIPLVVGILVALMVIAVGGAVVWTQRDAITAYLGTVGQRQQASGEKLSPKVSDRLGADENGQPQKPSNGTVKSVQTQTLTPPSDGTAQPTPAPSPTPTAPVTVAPPVPSTPVPPVAQKATLYEEGAGGASGQAQVTQGRVVWQVTRENTDPTKPPVTLLKARVEIPDRNISLSLVMHPNADPSFPASHLIELKFMTPADFDGKSIVNVPGMIMKSSEQARGEPLTGASAKVSNGYFWIALGAGDADRNKNLGLIRDRGWIDIPILYETNRRAILTIEKAGAGDRVVADAFSAWGQGG